MAIEFIDGVDHVDAAADLDGPKWDSGSAFFTVQTTAGRFGGGAIRMSSISGHVDKPITGGATVTIGFAFRSNGQLSITPATLALFQEGATVHLEIETNWSGGFVVKRGTTTVIAHGGAGSLHRDIWHYIEIKVVINDTTGSVEIRVDENSVVNATGLDTRNGGTSGVVDHVEIWGGTGNNELDDLYIKNDGTFLGDLRIDNLMPDGNGNYTEFDTTTNGGANHYQEVDEIGPDDDTTYNETTTATDRDTFTMANLTAITSQTIHCVQQFTYAKGTAASPGNIQNMLRISATDYNSANLALTQDVYEYHLTVWEQDPNAGPGAWTESVINGLESGYQDQ